MLSAVIPNVVMLSIVMLNVIMLSIIMLNVVAPFLLIILTREVSNQESDLYVLY